MDTVLRALATIHRRPREPLGTYSWTHTSKGAPWVHTPGHTRPREPPGYILLDTHVQGSTSTASGDREREIRRRVGVAWSANLSVVAIVGVLKEVFARERPSGLTSFAFPSGHTACASLLTGLALFVLLDPVWEVMNSPGAGENAQDDDSDTGAEAGMTVAARGVERVAGAGAPVGRDARLALWAAATAVTAAGRIVADRHWVTDTMAGAAIGIVFVSGSVAVLRLWQHEHEELDDTSI
jgi:hypothetical protein